MKLAKLNAIFAVLLLMTPVAALAQANLDPGQLPKSTMFYLAWHGTPSGEARKANSLLATWDDADFAPVRAAIIEAMMRSSSDSAKAALTSDELSQYSSLLDNEIVFGYIANPSPIKSAGARSEPPKNTWNGMFLVYDHTGKEATLAKLLLRIRMNEKDPPKISAATLAGIPAIKMERKDSTTYWADEGRYTFIASESAVFEDISAWARHATPAAARLSQAAAYREAGDLLKGGLAEFFFRFPSIREMTWDSSVGGFRLRPLIQSLKLEAVHSIAGQVALQGARTRIQGAILGETNPGTLFDIWDEGSVLPSSWQFITANTISYQEWRVNLPGVYTLVKRALQTTAGAGQPSAMDFIETGVAKRLGMPLPEAIALFTGEFATLQSSSTLDPAKQVYVVGIRKKPAMLKVLRGGLAERIAGEHSEGDTTFLKISEGGIANAAGTASWKYYHLAMTPDVIVASGQDESVRNTLSTGKSTHVENTFVPPAWQNARGRFPKTVNGLNFFNFQSIDWAAAKERWIAKSHKATTSRAAQQKVAPDAFADVVKGLDPRVFPRYLHMSAGASWKDAQGMHFDGWIE
jgi:hypothetical protein